MANIVLYTLLVGFLWGGWPLLARAAGETGMGGAFVLSASALVPIAIVAAYSGNLPTGAPLFKLIGGGIMMGLGLLAYNLIAGSSLVEMSAIVPIINTLMLLVTVIGGIILFSETVTPQKLIGVGLLIAGIFLLRPTP